MLPTSSCTTSAGRMPALSLPTVEALRGIVGAGGCLTPVDGDLSAYTDDWAHQFAGAAAAVLWPRSTQEVADIVRLCSREGIAITPQGGNTGRSGGSVPSAHERPNVILCLAKMNRIRKLDPVDNTITADAGVVLKTIQEAAQGIGRYFPLSLGAEGSCQIGGNVATNAGGTAVVRYGNARDLVLGLEVVTAQGEIWNGLRALRKDNAGYDLKSIYMGSEGTLGIITAVVLKLFSRPVEKATAWVATRDLAQAVGLLQHVQGTLDARLTAFEYLSRDEVELILRDPANGVHPLPATEAGGFVLLELSDSVETGTLHGVLESTLGSALERGVALDAAVAVSIRQAEAFWRIRHGVAEANISHGVQILHDISIPIGRIADCVAMLTARIAEAFPDGKTVYVTHLGDGNVHLSVIFPAAFWSKLAAPAEYKREVRRLVYDIVDRYGGTFCAEHGVGQSLVAEMTRYRSVAEIDLLTRIKRALDPANIMNPGKMLDLPAGPRSR